MSSEGFVVRKWLLVAPEWVAVVPGIAIAAAIVLYAPVATGMATMLAITVFCVSLWIATPVPPWFTSLIGVGLIGLTFSTDLALVGFSSAATWLIVFGILIGEATRASGLAVVVERWVLVHVPTRYRGNTQHTYRFLLVALCLAALGFAVVVPSALVRVLILAPMLVTIGKRFDSRQARLGLLFGPLFATYYGGAGILTGSLANIIVTGIVESTAGQSITWTAWLAQMGPLMSIGRVAVVIAVVYTLYRPPADGSVSLPDVDTASAMETTDLTEMSDVTETDTTAETGDERRMVLFLVAGVIVWMTDFLHGLHPLYGALLVVLLAYLPRIGVADVEAVGEADFSIVFFVGAIFAIAEGLRRTGFTDAAARTALGVIPTDAPLVLVLVTVVVSAIALSFLMEGLAVASVLTPVFVSFSQSAGIPLVPVAMMEAAALNTYFFPYQSAVLVAILAQETVEMRELIKTTALASLATLLVVFPLQIGLFLLLY
jgi:anion transporter